jgi:hypothetical protein
VVDFVQSFPYHLHGSVAVDCLCEKESRAPRFMQEPGLWSLGGRCESTLRLAPDAVLALQSRTIRGQEETQSLRTQHLTLLQFHLFRIISMPALLHRVFQIRSTRLGQSRSSHNHLRGITFRDQSLSKFQRTDATHSAFSNIQCKESWMPRLYPSVSLSFPDLESIKMSVAV